MLIIENMAETITLQDLHKEISMLAEKLRHIETNVEEIHEDLHHVKPGYLEKLETIKKGKKHQFKNKEQFLHFLHNEL